MMVMLLVGGCATIHKGSRDEVPVIGPAEARFFLGDSLLLPLDADRCWRRALSLPTTAPQWVRIEYGGRTDSVHLNNVLNGWYIVGNLFSFSWPGLLVDGLNGSWNDFNGTAIAYVADSVGKDGVMNVASEGGRWIAVPSADLPCDRPRRTTGMLVTGVWGVTTPVVQAPVFGNHVGVGLGFRVDPRFDLLAISEYQGCISLKRFSGPVRTSGNCDLNAIVFSVSGRYTVAGGLFASGSIGWAGLNAGMLLRDGDPDSSLHMFAGLPVIGLGAGYTLGPVFAEYRFLLGTERVVILPGSTAAVDFGTFRFGLLFPL